MKKTTSLLIALLSSIIICNAQNFLQKGADIDGEAAFDQSGISVSMPDKYTVAIGAKYNYGSGTDAGHVRIYSWDSVNGGAWVQKGNDIDGEAANDQSGTSVSMPDSNIVAIGANYNDGNGVWAGHVRIFSWSGSTWVQKGIDIDGESASDQSGCSVSMPDSNTIAIGAKRNDGNGSNAGHVRIYYWNGSAWMQKGNDVDGETAGDYSGSSVSMPDNSTVAIGSIYNAGSGTDAGHVRIYSWNSVNGGAWVQKGNDINGESANDQSGTSVSMPDSNTVAIGAPYNDGNGNNSGHVRIYRWNPANGGTWEQKGNDINGEAAGDSSGWSVSMPDSNTVAIGAIFNDGNGNESGHVRIYRWNGSLWLQKGSDIDGEATNDFSGISVSMPDSISIAIGATRNYGNGTYAGHTRVYSYFTSASVIENSFNDAVRVYPNPTTGDFSINLGANYNEATVIVRNPFGQIILKKAYSDSNLLKLKIPGDAGVYFVEVISNDKKVIIKLMKE